MTKGLKMHWMIDGKIDLTAIFEREDWHLASCISALTDAGLSREDAEAFADFAFNDFAKVRDRDPEDCVTDTQYDRLTVGVPA
jgi:hypothetical protein